MTEATPSVRPIIENTGATVEQLPVPEGSQAKPHFALKSGSALLSEITARSATAYFASKPLVGKRLKILVSRYYTSLTIEAYEI